MTAIASGGAATALLFRHWTTLADGQVGYIMLMPTHDWPEEKANSAGRERGARETFRFASKMTPLNPVGSPAI